MFKLGLQHSSAVSSNHRVFIWGYNEQGQLGIGNTINQSIPVDITSRINLIGEEYVLSSSLGGLHSAILTTNNRLFFWGRNSSGQLGNGNEQNSSIPIEIQVD